MAKRLRSRDGVKVAKFVDGWHLMCVHSAPGAKSQARRSTNRVAGGWVVETGAELTSFGFDWHPTPEPQGSTDRAAEEPGGEGVRNEGRGERRKLRGRLAGVLAA
jgi:hypothetical protein